MPDGEIAQPTQSVALRELVNLAAEYQQKNRLEDAGQVCTRIVHATQATTDPLERMMRGEAMNFLASLAAQKDQFGTAMDFFQEAIACAQRPEDVTLFRMNLTRLLLRASWKERARNEAERAVRTAPPEYRADAHRLRGLTAREDGDGELALLHQRTAHELAPEDEGALLEYAAILADTAQLDEAQALYQKVADTSTEYAAEGLHGVGLCLMRKMDCRAAIEHFNAALKMQPSMHMARWNRALSRLTVGDFKDGWRDHEARFLIGHQMAGVSTPMQRFRLPVWDGRSAAASGPKRVHIHAEQGLGDSLQFCRFALTVRDMGHDVRIEVGHELVDLLGHSLPGISVVHQAHDWPGAWGLEPFDCHIPMMSLPVTLQLKIEDLDGSPYLKPHPDAVMAWRKRLKDMPHPRVGICWHGRSRDALWVRELDRRRSLSFADLTKFMRNFPEMKFVSLQVDKDQDYSDPQLVRFDDDLKSFADTAALIANLDLVISVDTATMHCAAATGKPTWLLNRADSCWRWMPDLYPTSSPWYDSVKIYSQKEQGDWTTVLADVARDLEALPC